MKYGLSQSIYEIEEMLKNVISKKKIFGKPIYDRIIFIDENKKVIADTEKSENPSAIPEIDHSSKNTILSISDTHVTRAAPVTSGGVYSGIIISTSPLQVLQNYLKSIQPNTGPDQILIRNTGEIISGYTAKNGIDYKNLQNFNLVPSDVVTNLESLNSSTGNGKFPSGILAYRAIIPGTDLSLVSTVKSSVLYERTTAQINLALTALAPLLLALLSGMYYWLKSRDQRMKSMVAEATQKQVHLLGENEDLNNEIIRRISIENELRASEERYRMYIDHAPEGVVVFDNHGCIIDSNGAINEMLHCNSGSLIGNTYRIYYWMTKAIFSQP